MTIPFRAAKFHRKRSCEPHVQVALVLLPAGFGSSRNKPTSPTTTRVLVSVFSSHCQLQPESTANQEPAGTCHLTPLSPIGPSF